jgi:ABC-type amino acid transport substrate-binding protein
MIKKMNFVAILLMSFAVVRSQAIDSLSVNYYENFPYAYVESGELKGIEIDIIKEYVNWLKQKKNINVSVSYKPFKEFSTFYNSVKTGNSKVVGLGSVTLNAEREREILLSAPYLQNLAVLITAGKVPTIRTKTNPEVDSILGKLKAVVVNKSSHVQYINDIKKQFIPSLNISFVETQNRVLESIISDNSVFGYVDIVAYWAFLKRNQSKFLKIQKVFNEPKEYLSFAMPKSSIHYMHLNEFFESGFGFTATKTYHQILEKYLGYEIIESVEIK